MSLSLLVLELRKLLFLGDFTGNPEFENTSVGVLCNTWRLRQVRNTKFGVNVSNEKLINAAKVTIIT